MYVTETRLTRVIELPTAVRNAVVTHAEHNKIKLVEGQAWVTLRTKATTPSLLGKLLRRDAKPAPTHEMVLVVHPTHLVVGGSRGVVADAMAASVALKDASIVAEPDGFTIHGFKGAAPTFYMGLGTGADAEACRAAATKAIADAKAPPAPPPP